MGRFRSLDGNAPGYNRVATDDIGTKAQSSGPNTVGSPVLSEAWAVQYRDYTPTQAPVVPPSGSQFYRIYFDTYGTRLYLSEVQCSLSDPFNDGQLATISSFTLPTAGGNMASESVLHDGAWPSPYWSGHTSGELAPYTMIVINLSQAFPVRSIRIRTGGGGTAPSTVRVDTSNDPAAPGSHPFNGKEWTTGAVVFPTWTLFDTFNKWADVSVPL